MAEINLSNGAANGKAHEPQLTLQKIYIKDASFEAPNAPQIFQDIGESSAQPEVQLNLGNKSSGLGENLHEVVLTVTLTCSLSERTVYLAEVHQAGIFGIEGFGEQDLEAVINSYCPNLLFPYARQSISAMVQDGGFPPLLLQPINFEALYAEQKRREASGESAPRLNA